MNLDTLRRTAAEIAAAAFFETFPNVKLLGGSETSTGFYYDLYFPHIVHPELVSQIEERMRQIIREKRPIRVVEMVPISAKGYLKDLGHASRAEDVVEEKELIELIQFGDFIDLCQSPYLKNTAEVAAFKIFTIEALGGRKIRIFGTAHRSKGDLKIYLKKLEAYAKNNHLNLGQERGYWSLFEGRVIWEEKGLEIRKKAIRFLKKELFRKTREISTPIDLERTAVHCALAKGKFPIQIAEVGLSLPEEVDPEMGLLLGSEETEIQVSSFSTPEYFLESLISSLQTIGKTLTILGFTYSLFLRGRKHLLRALGDQGWGVKIETEEGSPLQIDFQVEDGLDRVWSAARIKGISTKEPDAFVLTLSVERIVALLLEKNLISAIETGSF